MTTKYEPLPNRYSSLIKEEQYIYLLELVQDFLANYGEVIKVEDGLIDFEANNRSSGDPINRFGLDNLIRRLAQTQMQNWPADIATHFATAFSQVEDQFDLNNFEAVRAILGVRVYPDSYFDELNLNDEIVYRVDFEETKSALVLDFPDKFQLVYRENFSNWGITEEQAFSVALQHAGEYEVEIRKHNFETFSQFSFFSTTHSVSYILDFKLKASMGIGKAGSLVNIPTQGSVFVIPIDSPNVSEMIEATSDTVNRFFDEDPGNINTNFYWYHDGKFTIIKSVKTSDGYRTLDLPENLVKILKRL
jgi:hypothetical protein